jgi:uncharacterized protein
MGKSHRGTSVRTQIQRLALLLSLSAACPASVLANDIDCASTQQAAARVICDHAILNNQYETIYNQQQAFTRDGKLSAEDLTDWQQMRDACTDVHCIDGVFAQWKSMAKGIKAGDTPATDASAKHVEAPAAVELPKQTSSATGMDTVRPGPVAAPATNASPDEESTNESAGFHWKWVGGIAFALVFVYGLFSKSDDKEEESRPAKRSSRRPAQGREREEGSSREPRREKPAKASKPAPAPGPKVSYSREPIRNLTGSIIGYTQFMSDGKTYLYSRTGSTLGWYNPKYDATYKPNGTQYARGNMLMRMLPEA